MHAGQPQLPANHPCAHHLVLGSASRGGWRTLDLIARTVPSRVNNADVLQLQRSRSGAVVRGDPRVALGWLANHLCGRGIGPLYGQFVTAGACMPPLDRLPGDAEVAESGVLGSEASRFTGGPAPSRSRLLLSRHHPASQPGCR